MMGRKGSRYDEQEPLAEALFSPIDDADSDGHEQITTLQWTKGEQQPPQCRDAWAAILFYGQLISIGVLAMVWGVPAVEKAIISSGSGSSENEADSSSDIDSMGLLYGERMISSFCYAIHPLTHTPLNYFSKIQHAVNAFHSFHDCRGRIFHFLSNLTHNHVGMSQSSHPNLSSILPNLLPLDCHQFVYLR